MIMNNQTKMSYYILDMKKCEEENENENNQIIYYRVI